MDGVPASVAAAGGGAVVPGPARVSGSAGTGKTVVAIHRAANILRQRPAGAAACSRRFHCRLPMRLKASCASSPATDSGIVPRVTVLPFRGVANELFTLAFGHHPSAASEEQIRGGAKNGGRRNVGVTSFTPRFLASEWLNVVDAWQLPASPPIRTFRGLAARTGLARNSAKRSGPSLSGRRHLIEAQGLLTWPSSSGSHRAFCGSAPTSLSPTP